MNACQRVTGVDCAPLDRECGQLLAGQRPEREPLLQALWQQLWHGQSPIPQPQAHENPAQQVLRMCLEALHDPGSLSGWPEELLEGQHLAGFLARLLAWTRLQEWMDTAPLSQEQEFLRQRERAQLHQQWLEQHYRHYLPLHSWYLREKARLVGFCDGDPLPWLESSLRLAGALGQQHEIARCRAFLAESEADPRATLDAEQQRQLQPLLAGVPAMVEATSSQPLRRFTLQTMLELVPMESAVWLEKDQQWEVLDWWPPTSHPRYSQTLVENCWKSQEFSWGQPEQLRASRSIMLSEVRSLMAVPVGEKGVIFAWQSDRQSWLSAGQIETVKFLAGLAGTLLSNLALTDKARNDLEQAEKLHRRWNTIFHEVESLALAELDDEGRLTSWNRCFEAIFPRVRQGLLASQLLPESEQARDRNRLAQLDPQSNSSALIRMDNQGQPRWYQCTDWKVPGESGSYRALLDVSESELELWFEYLEEQRHRLASDLHDGPAQVAALIKMQSPGPAIESFFEELRTRLDLLRSPWLEERDPWEWLRNLQQRHFPACELGLDQLPLARPQQQCLYRLLVDLLAQSQDGELQILCRGDQQNTEITWSPPLKTPLPETQERVESKLAVLHARWSIQPGRIQLCWS